MLSLWLTRQLAQLVGVVFALYCLPSFGMCEYWGCCKFRERGEEEWSTTQPPNWKDNSMLYTSAPPWSLAWPGACGEQICCGTLLGVTTSQLLWRQAA